MIIEFSIANFMSFKNRVTFSMLANNSKGLENNYVEVDKKRILKTAAIYGANASGKTNLFVILNLVVLMLRNSNNRYIEEKLPIVPFKFDEKSVNETSEFEIKFLLENVRYVYGFKADSDQIYEEYLYYYPNGRETKIFDRTNVNEYSYNQKDEKILKEIAIKNSKNKFFLATATNWNYKKTKAAYEFLTTGINTFFDTENLKQNSFMIYENNENDLKNFALKFLQKADFNIVDYKITKMDLPKDFFGSLFDLIKNNNSESFKMYQVSFKHKGSNYYLDFNEESLGTQIIFILIPFIFEAFNKHQVLVIDEFDRSLHPFLIQYLVALFNDPEINCYNAQLIFNTHDTNLLDLRILRRDQIWFTEKSNDTGISDLYALSDFAVRKVENVEKGYILGRYGAVPFIQNDINLW